MSKLIKAFTDLIEGSSKNSHKKASEPQMLKRSEFKTLIQPERSPVKRSYSSKYKNMKTLPDADIELMNEKEAAPCVY